MKATLSEGMPEASLSLRSSAAKYSFPEKDIFRKSSSSELIPVSNNGISYTSLSYPLVHIPIERNSEILVSIPHLTPDYFVLCIS